jgi:hypothetical protein
MTTQELYQRQEGRWSSSNTAFWTELYVRSEESFVFNLKTLQIYLKWPLFEDLHQVQEETDNSFNTLLKWLCKIALLCS